MVSPSVQARGARAQLDGPGFLARADLQVLFDLLREDGRRLIGPTVSDAAIAQPQAR